MTQVRVRRAMATVVTKQGDAFAVAELPDEVADILKLWDVATDGRMVKLTAAPERAPEVNGRAIFVNVDDISVLAPPGAISELED